MVVSQKGYWSSIEEGRRGLWARLRDRLPEIEEAMFTRVGAVSRPGAPADPEYLSGLRATVRDAIDYALAGLEAGNEPPPPIPASARVQARRAAQGGVALDTVLRRCHAGDRLLSELIVGEASDLSCKSLQEILRTLDPLVDQLTAAVATEHIHEVERMRRSPAQRLRERIGRLLAGDRDDDPDLAYELDSWHVGMVISGANPEELVRCLATQLDCQLLLVAMGDEDATWAWLGRRRDLALPEVEASLEGGLPAGLSLALGEPRRGIEGWRLTHLEAQAAFKVMSYRSERTIRCRDVILVSAVLGDRSLTKSLLETYLAPLDGRGDYGDVLRQTLRAYFAAGQNAVTAASALGVARHTVERRLRSVEEKLEQTIGACSAQLQVALSVEDLVSLSTSPEGPEWRHA
jgi:PucR C-terminal helix-turn-helix domain